MVEYKDLQVGDKIRECGFSNTKHLLATVTETRDTEFVYELDEPYYMRAAGLEGMVKGGTCMNHGNYYWEKI